MKKDADNVRYYLAYGSNLNISQMEFRCPNAYPVGVSMIPEYELMFRGSKTGSYLTIDPKSGGHVPVAVWAVTPYDEERLDIYEGFPSFYFKAEVENLPVKMLDGDTMTVDGFVYIMRRDRPIGIPSQAYVKTCRDGYRDFGFPETYLDDAVRATRQAFAEAT